MKYPLIRFCIPLALLTQASGCVALRSVNYFGGRGQASAVQVVSSVEPATANEPPTISPSPSINLPSSNEALSTTTLHEANRVTAVAFAERLVDGDAEVSGGDFAPRTDAPVTAAQPLIEPQTSGDVPALSSSGAPVPLNLPSVLAMVDSQHPVVGFARWRVQEAYAQMHQADVLWLPSIQSGFSFHRHDGNYQASNGDIVDVNRNSFQYGLGVGATGAGTTPRPGVVAEFDVADAYFLPEIAELNTWAREHASQAAVNQQLLTAALAYLELLSAEQDVRILTETRDSTADVAKLTTDFAQAGEGLQADADRLQTELSLIEARLTVARERADIAAADLAQAISLNGSGRIVPQDATVLPLEMLNISLDKAALIATGLGNRPELKEARALVSAALEQYKRQKYAPFVPSVLLGFSTGGFGGGLGNDLRDLESRYDFDALAAWNVRNLGFGERYARQEASAQIQQAKFEQVRVMDQVAQEISTAYAQVVHRRQRIAFAQQAIAMAEKSYERNLSRIRDGQGLPLEVLQSLNALEAARRGYLDAVVEFNQAQFQLQWALGWCVAEI